MSGSLFYAFGASQTIIERFLDLSQLTNDLTD